MFNEKFLFGFLNLGDDMLFPDWANGQEVRISSYNSHTLDKDAFVMISEEYDSKIDVSDVRINNVEILRYYTVNALPILASKGDVFTVASDSGDYISLLIFPLVRGGGK